MSQLPSYFDDEILGRMEYNPDLSWYEGWLDNERIGLPQRYRCGKRPSLNLPRTLNFCVEPSRKLNRW